MKPYLIVALAVVASSTASTAITLAVTRAPASAVPAPGADLPAQVRGILLDHPDYVIDALKAADAKAKAAEMQASREAVAGATAEIHEDGFSPVLGNPEGDVTFVLFSDYRCGYCRKAHAGLKELRAKDPGLRIIVKEFPILGPHSVAAARFALAVNDLGGPDAYAKVHDALFDDPGRIGAEGFAKLAGELGLDWLAVQARMDSDEVGSRVAATQALGEKLGITGTPDLVIGGDLVQGFVPNEALEAAIADLRSK
ncbi:DsbA family protein [Cereibacter sphaeroides]|uniref:DsbA family protein n=1 Tax=Cereibacter sphaeroides TaxID=1063 RepID=UPI001F44E0E7|nr:DsbA family protein [Cereibacter sphaeroides]MCE6958812.1 DsbA family protein [Cereibacter sphaeroides]MCE6973314.1 DsbA family protein [Cereibacter sphaeroides]